MAMVGRRQIGSTMKPYVYSLAMENGFSPCDQARHVEYTLIDENGKPWTPRNANKKRYGEMVTVKWGLANSDNWITAYLMSKLNPYELKRLVHSFGVRNRDIVPSVSLCLGPCEISVGEMVSAYTAFPNKGIRVAPLFVTRIEDNDGNVLATFSPEMQEVISASSAYKMLVMLRAVVNEGTGGRVRRLGVKADMGGKTGTTNSSKDVWFCGYTKYYTTVVWAGYDTPRAMPGVYGASVPGGIWKNFMNQIHKNKKPQDFTAPSGICLAKYDSKGNMIKGTESTDLKRTSGRDFFSITILKAKAAYADNLEEASYEKKVRRKLETFEKLTIQSMADYYTLEISYQELRDMISSIEDDDIRKSYATRAKNKYDSLKDETVKWKDVVKAYEEQQKESNAELAREKKTASKNARNKQLRKTRVALANTRLKALRGYDYQPDNMVTLLEKAKSAVEACRGYSEYASLNSKYQTYRTELYMLPTKAEYDAQNNHCLLYTSPSPRD